MATNTTNNQYKAKIYLTYSQGTNRYNFAFDYISKYYVKVRINNNDELTYGTHYTVADKTVTLNSVVTLSEGDLIEIFRETPTDKTVEWYDSSILRAQDLNLFNVQLMHINEENMDKLLDSGMQEDKLDNKWDARLKPIKNLANATKDDEAINYGFLKSTQNGYLQASQAKVDEATSKAREAMIQADKASAQAEIAKQNSTNAHNEANRAYSEAERAKGYADTGATQLQTVTTLKSSVESTKAEADVIKKAIENDIENFKVTSVTAYNTIDEKHSSALEAISSARSSAVTAVSNTQSAAVSDVENHKDTAVTLLETYKTQMTDLKDQTVSNANVATAKAEEASSSATSAKTNATNAANSATEAKTYKDQAKAIVGGDFATRGEMTEYVKDVTVNNSQIVITKGNGNLNAVTPDYAIASMQTKPKDLGGYANQTISAVRDLLNNELADMNKKGCSVRFIRFGANLSTIYNNWAKNWDATMSPGETIYGVISLFNNWAKNWDATMSPGETIYGVISLLSDDTYANVELVGWTGTTVLLQRIAGNWKTAETKVYTNGMLNVADSLKIQSNALIFDMGGGTQTNIGIGIAPKNYSGSGFTYTFYNGKNSLAGIVAKTQDVTDNSNNVATTAFVQSTVANKVSQLVNSAPSTLDTLNELANALGNDPNFATTVATQLGQKANSADVYPKSYIDNLVNTLYPVGIIVEFFNSVDPNTVWKGTTWERMSSGRVLVSSGTSSSGTTYTLGATGGEESHKLTTDEMPEHNHHSNTESSGGHTHTGTTSTDGNHTHTLHKGSSGSGGAYFSQGQVYGTNTGTVTPPDYAGDHNHTFTTSPNGTHTHTIDSDGGSQPHNNMQPYEVVNRWKRTA